MQVLAQNIVQFALVISVSSLFFYFLYFFKKLADFQPGKSSIEPLVSVIVCAKNELKNLSSFLPATLNQVYKNFEVIVVVDHSNDDS